MERMVPMMSLPIAPTPVLCTSCGAQMSKFVRDPETILTGVPHEDKYFWRCPKCGKEWTPKEVK